MGYTNGDAQGKVENQVGSSEESYRKDIELAEHLSPISPRFLIYKMGT